MVRNDKIFNWHSSRSRRARYGHILSGWTVLLYVIGFVFFALGAAFVAIGIKAGWLLLGLIGPVFMIAKWYRYDLKSPIKNNQSLSVDDILDADILALLPEQPSPKNIAEITSFTDGGLFFAARFGISGSFLKDMVSDVREDTEDFFKDAKEVGKSFDNRISAGVVYLVLIRRMPDKVRQTLLGHLQLSEEDIINGIHWHHSIEYKQEIKRQRSLASGGIGRDWSFGWIPYLSRFGSNISKSGARSDVPVRQETLKQLMESLSIGGGAVALVGKTGVGKTEMVYELAEKIMYPDETVPKDLHYRQIFLLSASRLISSAKQGDDIGTLVTVLLGEAYSAKNVIVCLDNAELFFESAPGSVDLLNTLMPIFEARRVTMILTLDEQKYLQIAKRAPELAAVVRRINLQPTSESETLHILQEYVPFIEYKYRVTIMYQALKEAYNLGKRYVYDVSMPGQATSLIDSAAEYPEDGLVTSRSVHRAIESTTGIKTDLVETQDEKETLLNLESRLHERMVGQNKAVNVVSDALRRARAGVRSQQKPVGTFLFLGPTGVGKTELAKSLADTYYGGEDNLIRLDMNEFVLAEDVQRLIADGADNPSSLTAQIMKQPFSVVLLDEIEKAHSSVLTTLLQLLDEGVLRDERNREISFRDTIVIATSNAGADRIQEYIQRGYSLEQFEEPFINELIGGRVFHPEFLNRFDEMVVFAPLSKNELNIVVDRILVGINKNLEVQGITVTVSSDAKAYLVEEGYDPRLGARPLRRVVQRAVESTVAKLLLSNEVQPGSSIELNLDRVKSVIETKRQADEIINN